MGNAAKSAIIMDKMEQEVGKIKTLTSMELVMSGEDAMLALQLPLVALYAAFLKAKKAQEATVRHLLKNQPEVAEALITGLNDTLAMTGEEIEKMVVERTPGVNEILDKMFGKPNGK